MGHSANGLGIAIIIFALLLLGCMVIVSYTLSKIAQRLGVRIMQDKLNRRLVVTCLSIVGFILTVYLLLS
jgi:hypothetical protein